MLTNAKAFFAELRSGLLGPTLSPNEVSGCDAILDVMDGAPLAWTAYALATAYHETASTMQPVKERGGDAYFTRLYDVSGMRPARCIEEGNTCVGDGVKFCGRGYVQLTWKNNYKLAGDNFGVDLVGNPGLALDPDIAAKILRKGMEEGWFTGKKFSDYLPARGRATAGQYVHSRYIINGSDRAQRIANFAKSFEDALVLGGWH